MRRSRLWLAAAGIAALALGLVALMPFFRSRAGAAAGAVRQRIVGKKTIQDRLDEFGAAARARLAPGFARAGVPYPPPRVALVGLKAERRLEVWAAGADGAGRLVASYPVRAASGGPGPKLREGDGQVPEGRYRVESLNPNSRFHVALRIGYPNEFDRAMAARDGRERLGGDIMIHGKAASIGCLAMGDEAAEDLFTLAADTGLDRIEVLLTPVDFRAGAEVPSDPRRPAWAAGLYDEIRKTLAELAPSRGAGP